MNLNPQSVRANPPRPTNQYWRHNLCIMAALIFIWAAAGLGAGVLFADWLNTYRLIGTGFPLGFWFAHQGSIVIFVALILLYCILMNRLDDHHQKDKKESSKGDVR